MTSFNIVPISNKITSNEVILYNDYTVASGKWPTGALWSITNMFGSYDKVSLPFLTYQCQNIKNRDSYSIRIDRISGTTYPNNEFFVQVNLDLIVEVLNVPATAKALSTNGSVLRGKTGGAITNAPAVVRIYFLGSNRVTSMMTLSFYYSRWRSLVKNITTETRECVVEFKQYASNSFKKIEELTYPRISSLENPTIQIVCATDIYIGDNLGQIVYAIQDTIPHKTNDCFRPTHITGNYISQISLMIYDFSSVILGDDCSLSDKMIVFINNQPTQIQKEKISGQILLYGLTRYILTWLITGKFSTRLLLDKYTNAFLLVLSKSRYSNFMEYFLSSDAVGINKYYKYNL